MKRHFFTHLLALAVGTMMTLASAPAQAWLWGSDHPGADEIENWIAQDVPDFFEIIDIEIGLQEMRTVFGQEYSASRVLVTIDPREPLYLHGDHLDDGKRIVHPAPPGPFELGYVVEAVEQPEGWEYNIVPGSLDTLRGAGRTLGSYGDNVLIAGSAAYNAHMAERAAREAALYDGITGEFAGTIACRRAVYEVARLTLDPRRGAGSIVYNEARNVRPQVREEALTIGEPNRNDVFYVSGASFDDRRIQVWSENGRIQTRSDCEIALYPVNDVPAAIVEQRATEAEWLATLSEGPVAARLFEGDTERRVGITITDVFERGFRMTVDQPQMQGARFNTVEENRSEATIDVRFVDPPARPRIAATLAQGHWGRPVLDDYCAREIEIHSDGTLTFVTGESFGCNERLTIAP